MRVREVSSPHGTHTNTRETENGKFKLTRGLFLYDFYFHIGQHMNMRNLMPFCNYI